ncbi:MAG: transporter ATP-binding protein [Marmoricola sp.]|jgi:ABC-2 type transport system ATP-binding protein|nr:transporter ATP-binding protein [Marmoricola sp.]
MYELVIETTGLRKEYRARGRKIVAVDGLDLAVPAGGVHGFLGPNGSGKTTTIRMLLGLSRATSGQLSIFGQRVPEYLPQLIDRIGALVEEPKFVPTFSGRKNLSMLARTIGIPRTSVDKAIEDVGLKGREKERYKGYSYGMKQRLAVAAALLKSPDLLILDEPTNGLDPAGIRDIRDMIRHLGDTGVTVLLSSHILAEVQQVCSSVSIIGQGKLLASGKVSELLGDNVTRIRVGVAEPEAAMSYLTKAGYAVTRDDDKLIVEGPQHPEEITRVLALHQIWVSELSAIQPDLESFFLQLTADPTTAQHRPRADAS